MPEVQTERLDTDGGSDDVSLLRQGKVDKEISEWTEKVFRRFWKKMERPTDAIDRLKDECIIMQKMDEISLVSDIVRVLAWIKHLENEESK